MTPKTSEQACLKRHRSPQHLNHDAARRGAKQAARDFEKRVALRGGIAELDQNPVKAQVGGGGFESFLGGLEFAS